MITIQVVEDDISNALGNLQETLDDLSPVMSQIGEFLVESTRKRITSGVTPEGQPFAPKASSTIQNYLANGFRKGAKSGPLIRTGDMLSDSLNFDHGPDFVSIGSSALQAAVMHFGAAKGSLGAYNGTDKRGRPYSGVAAWGNIPARPFLGISTEDRSAIMGYIADSVFENMAASLVKQK